MIARTVVLFALAVALLPDEGQWLPTQVREWDWDALQRRGMRMTKDEFWHPERGGVLSATVQINGCTASFVSADGLLVTNHHCGFDAVSQLSSVEHNWLRDGFAAPSRAAELPAPGMVAFVLKRIEDVTATVHEAQDQAKSDLERWQVTQQTITRLCAEAQQKEPATVCSVASFLEGKEYHLYYRTKIEDVRLVYAPPRAIGEFGGEVDNWEWPRHTGDFTFFRAYVAPDGAPRVHHADNVPYRPAHFLRVATGGARDGDLAIIMGYPGNTQRYKTSRAVATRQGYVYPKRDELLTAVLEVLEQASRTDEQKALAVASRIKSLANVQKNARGMVFGLQRNGVVEHKRAEEQALAEWIAKDPQRTQRWGSVLADLLAIDEEEAQNVDREMAVGFAGALLADAPLLATLVDACAAVDSGGAVPAPLQAQLADAALVRDLDLIQVPVLAIVLGEFARLPAARRLRGTERLLAPPDVAAVRALLAASHLGDAAARSRAFAAPAGGSALADAIAASDDPLLVLARGLAAERRDYQRTTRERQGRMLVVGRRWIEAQEAFRGKAFYPDANSTLRVSIATLKGYQPRDGVFYRPHTTVAGLLQKETGKEPFANPAALLQAAAQRERSACVDPDLGDVPVCFLLDGDTTGGNSGSPVVDGSGRLIGLNFDRVFENVAGDFGWNADRSRNICVDIRYVLWILESVLPAPDLRKELGDGSGAR